MLEFGAEKFLGMLSILVERSIFYYEDEILGRQIRKDQCRNTDLYNVDWYDGNSTIHTVTDKFHG